MRRRALERIGFGLLLLLATCASFGGCVGDDPASVSANDAGATDTSSDAPPSGDTGSDGGGGNDGNADAGPRCDPNKPFANKRLFDGINLPGTHVESARLTPDEKTVYFYRYTLGSDAGASGGQIFVATRATTNDPFSAGLPLNAASSTAYFYPAVTGNELSVYASIPGPGGVDIVVSSRNSKADPFGPFASLNGITSDEYEENPYVLPDQSAIYFHGFRDSGASTRDLYRAANLGGGAFGPPQLVSGVNTADREYSPVAPSNERTIYFSRSPAANLLTDIFVARRPNTTSAFGAAAPVAELNTPQQEWVTWISDDDCVILFDSDLLPDGGTGPTRVYIAERSK